MGGPAPAAGFAAQASATAGEGVVTVYDEIGNFLHHLVTGGALAAPWGVALAPANFGQFGGDLLVGNFSYVESGINPGNSPSGLRTLDFGPGGNNGNPDTLYFTDGVNGEIDGLFGRSRSSGSLRPGS